jgi:hypothetical protein
MSERKSLLPLIEILISVGIFAVAVILTLQIFMLARFLGFRTSDTADAILEVQRIAETIKSFQSGDEISSFFANEAVNPGIEIVVDSGALFSAYSGAMQEYELSVWNKFYDGNWQRTDDLDEAVYIADIIMAEADEYAGVLYLFEIRLSKIEPYPFINDRIVEQNPQFRPQLASISAGKFINNN